MNLISIRALTFVLVATCLPRRTFASDWYVDAVNGDNANSGASATNAWRTISFAIANTPTTGQQRIYVAAGHYDEALGETFPLRMRNQMQLIGAGPDSTEIVNNASFPIGQFELYHALVMLRVVWETGGPDIQPGTLLQGFRISTAHPSSTSPDGIFVQAFYGRCDAELHDLQFDSLHYAFRIEGGNQYAAIHASNVVIRRTKLGVGIQGNGRFYGDELTLENNQWSALDCGGASGTSTVSLSHSRITANPTWAMSIDTGNYPYPYGQYHDSNVDLSDCLIARNGTPGYSVPAVSLMNGTGGSNLGSLQVHITRCTIADNEVGIGEDHATLNIDSCLIQNSVDDLSYVVPPTVSYSNISDGDFAGTNGNISAAATFIDAANADYRLAFGSPGIDIGNPATPAGTLDILGVVRPVDGDLDTVERCDIGVFEFAPLFRNGGTQVGTLMTLELRGPQGASATLLWTRGALAAAPMSSTYGQFDLEPSLAHVYRVVTVGPVLPGLVQRTIPNSPLLVGQTFAFQALTNNPLAPAGKAYTNAVQFTVLP